MKENDYLAVALNLENSGIQPTDLRAYGISPNNTGLQDKDYYKNIKQVQDRFKNSDGTFNESDFNNFYDSVRRSYSDFAQDDYINNLIKSIPSSAEDIFSLGDYNIEDDSARIIKSRDPNRHQMGIGNIMQTGPAVFSEREVAQHYNTLDENGNELDWSPNDRGGFIKGLFRPTLALAVWEEDGTHLENGREVIHHKGEHKYDENGNPRYQVQSNKELYDREILHWGDTITREGTFWNKIDPYDFDGVKTNPGKLIYGTFVRMLPYLTPAAEVFGAIEAARALSQTVPVVAKSINGMITNNNDNGFGKAMTSVENWANRFDISRSDEGGKGFFTWENVAQQLVDSAKQLYSQGLIQKLPGILHKHPTLKQMQIGQNLALAYMATTSAEDVYGAYKQAGVNDAWAGIGALATMGAFYAFMSNDYFKTHLFNDPALELPELKRVIRNEIKTSTEALEQRIAANEGLKLEVIKKGLLPTWTGEKWYNKTYNAVAGALNKVLPKLQDNAYLVRGLNEGLEEVMEESATDVIKGMTLGAQELGFNVVDEDATSVDFGFTPEDFIQRYATSFIGGALGGTVFEGLQQWNNRVLHRDTKLISDLALDEQLAWYIRNGRARELLQIVDNFEKRGKFGSKNLNLNYTIEDDKIVWNATDSTTNNQNTQLANALRQKIQTIQSELIALNFVQSDNEILQKATVDIEAEAKKAGFKNVQEFKDKRLRDERIDFLKQRQVDKLIISDVADLQFSIKQLTKQIESEKAKALNVPDTQKSRAEENLKSNQTIKLLEQQRNDYQKALDEILSGKRAYDYLGLGLFAGDDELVDLYLARKAEDGNTSYYITNLKNFVRARYNANLDELVEKSGGRDAEGKSDIEEFFKGEYNTFITQDNELYKIRQAYEIHKALGKLINPVLQQQIADYSGYKSDPNRESVINALQDPEKLNELSEKLNLAEKAVADYVQANIDKFTPYLDKDGKVNVELAKEIDPELERLSKEYNKLYDDYGFYGDPRTVLDRAFKTDDDKQQFLDLIGSDNIGNIFSFLNRYYQHLNDQKIVSEFSDDFYRIGIASAARKMMLPLGLSLNAYRDKVVRNAYTLSEDTEAKLEALANNSNFANYILTLSLFEGDSNDSKHTLQEVFTYFYEQTLNPGPFYFNGEIKSLDAHLEDLVGDAGLVSMLDDSDSILDEVASILDPDNEYDSLSDGIKQELFDNLQINKAVTDDNIWKTITSRLKGVLEAFEKDPDYGIQVYNGAVEMVQDLINDGSFQPGTDAKTWIDRQLFSDGINLVDETNKLKSIRANMIHTPVLDWVRALSVEYGGTRQDLLDLLTNETKELISKDQTDDYVINNPFVKDELDYLQNALSAISALLKGSNGVFGANFWINQLIESDENKLPVIENQMLSDVYSQDLQTILDRVAYLNYLNQKNNKGIVKQRMEAFTISAPKLFKALFKGSDSTEDPKDNKFWIGKFYDLGINLVELWNDRFDLDSVTVDNVEQFWHAAESFLKELYDKISSIDWTKESAKRDNKSVDEIIADILMSPATDVWRLKNSSIDTNPETITSDLDVVLFMASMLSADPKEIFGKMKAAAEHFDKKPFWDQMLAICIGHGKCQNKNLFNIIGKTIYDEQVNKANNNNDPDFSAISDSEMSRMYFKARPLIANAINIDGASGTGKSDVVLRFIHYMNNQSAEPRTTIVTAKYGKRMEALKSILDANDDQCFTFAKLTERLLGRNLKSDDFESHVKEGGDGHAQVLKQSVIDELKARTNIWGTDQIVDVYIDESGLFSEAELVFLSEASKLGKVNLIFAGDRMQNGALTSDGLTSDIADCVILGTPRLTLSMRVGNNGMITNLNMIEDDLARVDEIYRNEPWITSEDANRKLGGILQPRTFSFSEKPDAIYGFAIVTDGQEALNKLISYKKGLNKGPKIAIITDNPSKYSSNASSDIEIISIEEVQGGEYDYVLADISTIDESRPNVYYKKVYTIISRARTGGYIVNGLGSKFEKSVSDSLASIIINPTSSVENTDDITLDKYKDWWSNKLMSEDIWNGVNPVQSTTPITPIPSTPVTNPTPIPPGTNTNRNTPVELPPFDVEQWKKDVIEQGSKVKVPYTTQRSKQRLKDLDNYRKYHETIKDHSSDGTLMDFKGFIDVLLNGGFDDYIFGTSIYALAGNTLSEEEKLEIRKFIRNFTLDFYQLSIDELKEKYRNNTDWKRLFSNKQDFINAFEERIQKLSEKVVYSVVDGNDSYLYFWTGTNKMIPIGIIKGGTHAGWVRLNLTEITPMTMLSSYGRAITDPRDMGDYVEISDKGYVFIGDIDEIGFTEDEEGQASKAFARGVSGKAQFVVNSTFGNQYNINKTFIPEKGEDGRYKRVDSTGKSKGRTRFAAAARYLSFTQYIKLAGILNAAHSRNAWNAISPDDKDILLQYIRLADWNELTSLTQEDVAGKMQALRKASILQPEQRDLLVTALIRYYNRPETDKQVAEKFFNNLNKWASEAENQYKAKDATVIRQHGIKFSLINEYGQYVDFHIVLNKDKSGYDIYFKQWDGDDVKEQLLISNFGSENYFNFSLENSPEKVAQNLIAAIINEISTREDSPDFSTFNEFKSSFLSFDSDQNDISDYSTLFKNGNISFSLTTKRIRDEKLGWFEPFDTDIAYLMEDIVYNDDIEEFLKNDAIFKYGLIIGLKTDSEYSVNDDNLWITTNADDARWDIVDILPPLYEVNTTSVNDDTLPQTFGTLLHSGSSDNKTDIIVDVTIENGKPIKYTLNTPFRISREDLSKFINVNNLSSSTEFKFNEIESINGNWYIKVEGRNIKIEERELKILLDGMTLKENINPVIAKVDDWEIILEDGVYKIQNGENVYTPKVISNDDGNLLVYVGKNVVAFNNIPNINFGWNKFSTYDFIGINNNQLWYIDKSSGMIHIFVDGLDTYSGLPTINDGIVKIGNLETLIEERNPIYNFIKSILPQAKKVSILDVTKDTFEGKYSVDFSDPLLNNDPNAWAIKNAETLDGIWTWNGKKWKQLRNDQIKWRYAQIIAEENGTSVIDEYQSINEPISIQNGTFKIGDRLFKVENIGDSIILSELIPTKNIPDNIERFIKDVQSFGDENVTSMFDELIKLTVAMNTGNPINADRLSELHWQFVNMCNTSPEIKTLYSKFMNFADDLQQEITCRIV